MREAIMCLVVVASPLSSAILQPDVLVYNEGDTQIRSEIDVYQSLAEGMPVKGSIFVTHDSSKKVDEKSFRLGDKALKVEFVRSVPMESNGPLEVSIYRFTLEGLHKGTNILPPVIVKVGAQEFQAPPMSVDIGG